jgi:hypothetical protein
VKRFSQLSYMYFLYFPLLHSWKTAIFEISELLWAMWGLQSPAPPPPPPPPPPPNIPSLRPWDHCFRVASDFASAFLSPGVKSRTELVPSPRAYARNGVHNSRWLGNYVYFLFLWIHRQLFNPWSWNRKGYFHIFGSLWIQCLKHWISLNSMFSFVLSRPYV